ncbi:MAG: mobA [Chloroflexi bacterium]|nr:mobA [Chloroflexota bacterium]
MDVGYIILAGGKSTRLGRNKVFEIIGQKSLLERAVSCLSSFKSEIIVVKAKDSSLPELTGYPELRIVTDVYPGKGSLGGIYTGLVASKAFYNMVVACDMPFLNLDLLRYMIDLAREYDVVIPKVDDEILEPLHAVYSGNCIPPLEFLIKQNRLSILELFPMVKVRNVANSEINQFDPQHLSFFNINTEADLQKGLKLAGKEGFKSDKC